MQKSEIRKREANTELQIEKAKRQIKKGKRWSVRKRMKRRAK